MFAGVWLVQPRQSLSYQGPILKSAKMPDFPLQWSAGDNVGPKDSQSADDQVPSLLVRHGHWLKVELPFIGSFSPGIEPTDDDAPDQVAAHC